MKFARRKDVSDEVRQKIAMQAFLNKGVYGAMTRLAILYGISRTFTYQLLWALEYALATDFHSPNVFPLPVSAQIRLSLDAFILLLRLEGNCSIQKISNILKKSGYKTSSTGYISERLKQYGEKLSPTLHSEERRYVFFLSDEIFAGSRPILITVESKSMAILRIDLAEDRSADTWKAHWIEIQRHQFFTLGLVSDRGKGLTEGFKGLFDEAPYQPDLFHDLRDLSKIILVKLEKAAQKAAAEVDTRWKILDSARSERVINERIEAYEEAVEAARKARELYEDALYLFQQIQHNLDLFDVHGNLKDPQAVRGNIEAALDLMQELDQSDLWESAQTFKDRLDSLLRYFGIAQNIHQKLSEGIPNQDVLQALCLAWQWDHKYHQAKSSDQNHYCAEERDFWLAYAEAIFEGDFPAVKEHAFDFLDTIVRSSSLVEAVNSLIRPYLHTCKGQITQEMLNLIMFSHNHRKFNDGKRKNKAPIEILTGKKLEQDWLDMLLEL